MRKIYLFFALLIGISSAAWAKNFTPEDGAIYTIRNKGNKDFVIFNSGNNNASGVNILSSWGQFDERSFFIIKGDATNGYTLQFKNDETRYVYWVNKNDADANVGTKQLEDGATVPDDCKWQFVENGTGTWNIKPLGGSNGWNRRGSVSSGNTCIGQWGSNSTDDNRWYIQKPSEMAPGSSVTDNLSNTIGLPTQDWLETAIPAHNAATTLEETFTSANAAAFYTAWAASSLPVSLVTPSQPASGLFKIKNAGTGKYLFQSEENNAKGVTLLNDGGDNSKYYWTANFSGNDVTLKGSLGQAPKRGAQGKVYANIAGGIVMNTITMEGAPSGSAEYTENTFLWPNVHSTTANDYTIRYAAYNSETNPAFLTTWPTTGTADQYTFEAVELADGEQVYTVNVNTDVYNCDANVTFNSDSYAGNKTVNNGGFFILTESQAQAENFSAVNIKGNPHYIANVAIEGTTINVTYTINTALQASDYVAYSEANKVGYPTSTCQVVTDLKSALQTYQNSETAENLSALSTALTAYKNETTNISMPVDGKAYTFKHVSYNNVWRYMKYAESGMGFSTTKGEATTFVCRKVADGQYAFVNNDGKYLIWKGNDAGANSQKGYADAYDFSDNYLTDWAKITITKLTAGSGDKTGYVCVAGRRTTEATNYRSNIILTSNGAYDKAGETTSGISQFFNANYSSAFLIEDATYANVVSLKDALGLESGKNIATFSAPFPTVVPANTTAYSVETQMASNVTEVSTYKVAEAGEAIPANTGVILMGTDTQVTMLPRTTETTVVIAEGALGNSAGAAKDITTENSYVLANKSGWAFYKVGDGATALPMNKAYLVLPESSESVIRFNFGNTTGMELVGADAAAAQGKVYDLSGREVKVAAKGLYIVGGKKVIVK